MNQIEKDICTSFLKICIPKEFIDTPDKLMMNEYIKGNCSSFLNNKKLDKDILYKMKKMKNNLANTIDFSNKDNVVYFDLLRLMIAIIDKNL